MLYFIALFCSPLALLLALKPFSAILNAMIYVAAWFGLLLFIGPGVIVWLIGVAHAWMVISGARADRRTTKLLRAQR